MKNTFFEGLKVVELAGILAGPAVGMFFAELGAEVLKIENPALGGDATRNWRTPNESTIASISAYYASVNYGKKVIWADLNQPEDYQKVVEEIQVADILITNYKPSSALKLGMSDKALEALNPRLIIAKISGYGETDETPAFDVVLQAEAGFMFMNGEADGKPTKMPVALIDILAAHQLKEAILLALLHREKTQKGSIVHISLLNAAIASLANQATNWLMTGYLPQRIGSLHPNIAPYGEIFHTKDLQQIVLAIGTDRHFSQLVQALDIKELATQPKFMHNKNRVENRTELAQLLQNAFSQFLLSSILPTLKQAGVPCGTINSMREVAELAAAKELLITDSIENQPTLCFRTAAFDWRESE